MKETTLERIAILMIVLKQVRGIDILLNERRDTVDNGGYLLHDPKAGRQ